MTAIEILHTLLYIPHQLVLTERPYSEQFTIVEISTDKGIPFKMYYYIVDTINEKAYYGGYEVPEGVTIALIERGIEPHIVRAQ